MKYIIYQPKEVSFRVDSDKVDYNKADYNKVYEGEINEIATNSELLEKIFEKFNIARPHDFHGHSLSVGDIVILKEDDFKRTFICDIFGWNKINLK
jgi:hypothetical protein